MKRFNIVIMLLITLISCQKTEIAQFQDKAVVEAYLFAGHTPVVTISKQIPFLDDAAFSDMDVDKLSIQITEESTGKIYPLTAMGGGKYTNNNLHAVVGETYHISFPYNGEIVEATTTVPTKPLRAKLSQSSITVTPPGEFGGGGPGNSDVNIIWENEDNSYYLIVVENIETNPVAVFDEEDYTDEDLPSLNFRSEPTTSDTVKISSRTFQYYGRHRILLHKIQPEYALLYSKNSNSSQSLSEIHANVTNGFGIFTAINTDTLYLRVLKP